MTQPKTPFIRLLPHSLTQEGRNRAIEVYKRASIYPGEKPKLVFCPKDVDFIKGALSDLRRKDWRSSNPMGKDTEATGILSEIALSRFLGESASQFFESFEAALGGDPGYDTMIGRYRIDCKGTVTEDKIYNFSKQVANSTPAHIFTFASVQYAPSGCVAVTLEAWAWVAEVKPWIREQKISADKSRYKARLWRLKQEGILQPMAALFALSQEG